MSFLTNLNCPTFDNNYYVRFKYAAIFPQAKENANIEHLPLDWHPASYMPTEDVEFFKDIVKKVSEYQSFGNTDLLSCICSFLDPSDIGQFALVSCVHYIASKSEYVWRCQLKKLLPHVAPMSKEMCSYSTEGQFKIAFSFIKKHEKCFTLQRDFDDKRSDEHIQLLKTCIFPSMYSVDDPRHIKVQDAPKDAALEASLESKLQNKTRSDDALQKLPTEFDDQYKFEDLIMIKKAGKDIISTSHTV